MSALVIAVLCSCLSIPAWADYAPEWTFNGFATLGVVHNSDSNVEYVRDLSQPDSGGGQTSLTQDTLFGLQGSYGFSNQLRATAQVVSKYHDNGSYRPELSWGYLSYQPDSDVDFRIGRLGLDIFFHADSRDIGYSYLWARPISDYYGPLSFSSFEGVDATKWFQLGEDTLKLKAYWGSVSQSFPDSGYVVSFDHSPVMGLIGEYQQEHWSYRLSYTRFKYKGALPVLAPLLTTLRGSMSAQAIAVANEVDTHDQRIQYLNAAAAYDNGPWRLQMALSHTASETLSYPDNTAAFVSLGYRLNGWTPYVAMSRIRSDQAQRTSGLGTSVDNNLSEAIRSAYSDQYSVLFGGRVDLSAQTALKIQLEKIHSNVNPSLLMSNESSDWDGNTTLFSLTLDYVF